MVDCNTTLQNALADLGKIIEDTNAKIIADTLPALPGYSTELKVLFQNLIGNALKFTKKDTRPELKITARQIEDLWEFSFRDNGIGIDEINHQKIFDIFNRLHSRSEYEGSGIGLAHCRKIVELHGGTIWVLSSPGSGSTFYFTIPIVASGA